MVKVTKARTAIHVKADYDPAFVAVVKTVHGYEWDKAKGTWKFPLDPSMAVELLDRIAPFQPQLDKAVWDWVRTETHRNQLILQARGADDATLAYEHHALLYRYQRLMVNFMATAGRVLNTDQMGLGKTPETIGAIRELELRGSIDPVAGGYYLIICPNSVKHNWVAEIRRWYNPDTDIRVVKHGKEFKGMEPAWYIVNWELMWRRMSYLEPVPWDVIVGDESHRTKNRATSVTKGLMKLKQKAPHKFLLTGTPIKNEVTDLWTQLHFLYPERFSSYWKFFDQYAESIEDFYGHKEIVGVRNEEQLREQLSTIAWGRTLDDIEVELPPLIPKMIQVDLAGDQLKAYERMRDEFIAWIEGEDERILAPGWMTQVLRLKQIAGSLGIFYEDKPESAKLDALDDLMDEAPADDKFVVMSQFETMVQQLRARLEKKGIAYCEMTGKNCRVWTESTGHRKAPNRQELIDYFQNSDTPKVFIATTQTGGEGITLTAARRFVFLDLLWTPGENMQALKRIHRMGQTRTCFVYAIVARNTVDFSAILPTLKKKSDVIRTVLRPDDEAPKGMPF